MSRAYESGKFNMEWLRQLLYMAMFGRREATCCDCGRGNSRAKPLVEGPYCVKVCAKCLERSLRRGAVTEKPDEAFAIPDNAASSINPYASAHAVPPPPKHCCLCSGAFEVGQPYHGLQNGKRICVPCMARARKIVEDAVGLT